MLASALQYVRTSEELLEEAKVFLQEAFMLITSDSLLQQHQVTFTGLNARAQVLLANNSLQDARALRKEAVEFRNEVRRHRDNLRLEELKAQTP